MLKNVKNENTPLSYFGNPLLNGQLWDRRKRNGKSENSFFAVFGISDIRKYIFSFQLGKTFYEYDRADLATKHGYIELIKYMCDTNIGKYWNKVLMIASKFGHLQIIKFLYDNCKEKFKFWEEHN